MNYSDKKAGTKYCRKMSQITIDTIALVLYIIAIIVFMAFFYLRGYNSGYTKGCMDTESKFMTQQMENLRNSIIVAGTYPNVN